jgi:antitoxin VapB
MNKHDSTARRAKIFWSGRSQAVRLPKEFRFDSDEVTIRREGDAVVIEPVADDWAWLRKMPGYVDADFEAAVNEEAPTQPPDPSVEDFFK